MTRMQMLTVAREGATNGDDWPTVLARLPWWRRWLDIDGVEAARLRWETYRARRLWAAGAETPPGGA